MKYLLILTANNGEQAKLIYETINEALQMKNAFMVMGQYSDSEIVILNEKEVY
jgi:hypothetical protein